MSDLRERAARACAYAVEMQHSTLDVVNALGFPTIEAFVDKTWRNYLPQADAVLALALEEAAKVAERMSDEWDTQWRANCKISQHVEGMSDGAHEVAAAIRTLEGK